MEATIEEGWIMCGECEDVLDGVEIEHGPSTPRHITNAGLAHIIAQGWVFNGAGWTCSNCHGPHDDPGAP